MELRVFGVCCGLMWGDGRLRSESSGVRAVFGVWGERVDEWMIARANGCVGARRADEGVA